MRRHIIWNKCGQRTSSSSVRGCCCRANCINSKVDFGINAALVIRIAYTHFGWRRIHADNSLSADAPTLPYGHTPSYPQNVIKQSVRMSHARSSHLMRRCFVSSQTSQLLGRIAMGMSACWDNDDSLNRTKTVPHTIRTHGERTNSTKSLWARNGCVCAASNVHCQCHLPHIFVMIWSLYCVHFIQWFVEFFVVALNF